VADSPAPGESLVKREADLPAQDPIASRSTSGWMFVSALLLTISIAWALYDEAFGQRPWKGMQREFVSRYTKYLDSIKADAGKSEAEIKESPEYTQLADAEKAARDEVQPEIAEIDKEVAAAQRKLDAITDTFQNQRGRLTVINYNIEVSQGGAKKRYQDQAHAKREEKVTVEIPSDDGKSTEKRQLNYAELEGLYNELRDKKAERLGRKGELLKTPSELAKKKDDYLRNHLIGLGPAAIEGLKTKMANYDYSILGHQISVNAYNIVDRCEVCHAGIREPLDITPASMAGPNGKEDSLSRAFVSHPNKEILQLHNPEKFGCASCHWGNGRATTSEVKGHGRHRFWLWPMFEKENTEAGCQQCHSRDRVTQGAETLNLGRDLFSQRGCMGCHRYEGFDRETDSLAATRQQIGQLQDQITANEKQILTDTKATESDKTTEDEVKKLLAHAESLRVTNSLLAARIDQMKLQERYLLQDVKKVGPNLKDVRVKLRKEWVPVWLHDPRAFRNDTKMPVFWRFGTLPDDEPGAHMRDKDGEDQIRAIAAYLWQESFDSKLPAQQQGDAQHGKTLFESRGCLACHSIGPEGSAIGGHFAANLQRIGEKANFDYIVRWIHNPRERVAPYCPKHKRDLTAEDYAKKGLPFVFDTELHSRCPEDGAELQVQNMTVMPNFRLSETDARDIATYLFSLSSPPSYEASAYMDDANLKEKGRQLIKQYGCAGCHEIKGFEDEQRIGKELTVEGATPIERLDFALQTKRAEEGVEPIKKLKDEREERKLEEKPWYNHKGFFTHKITQPSIYDEGKEKDPKDRLRMPQPYMPPEWRNALTTFLLGSVGTEGANVPGSLFYNPQDQRRQDIQNGWWVIKKYNCQGCHQLQVGQRSIVMDLPFYQTPEGKDLLPPRLTSEGARVDPAWLLRFLHDPSLSGEKTPEQAKQIAALPSPSPQAAASPGASPAANNQTAHLLPQPGLDRNGVRPYLQFRMPTFNFSPNELQVLVRFFMAMSGQQDPYIKEPLPPLTAQERLLARQLFTSGTPCLKCHITGDPGHDAKAIAPNFLLASERLKPDWTVRWLLDPAQISPGTAMPSGLFRKEDDRMVANLPTLPPAAAGYEGDHSRLLMRYMFLMSPDEQRALLATGPATTAAPTTQNHASAKRKRRGLNHVRSLQRAALGRKLALALRK
jgi:cytochrome c2/cytochrome c peroxidase